MNNLNLENIFELYNEVKDDVKFFIGSDVRVKILISLTEGSKNLAQLRNEIHLSSSTILHGMYQLEKKSLIFRESGNYYLSQTGEIATNKLIDVVRTAYALNRSKNLFLNHEIGSIPPELLNDLGSLENADIIRSTSTDIMKPHTVLSNFLSGTENVKHLSSVFFTRNVQLMMGILENRGKVDLLLTEEILNKLMETSTPEILENALLSGNLKLGIVQDETKLSFTLGDNFMALGLFSTNGAYDLNTFLVCEGKDAIFWGERLFNHYLQQATEFKL